MPLCPSEQQLRQFLADELSAPTAAEIDAHVNGCAACQEKLERWTAVAPPPGPRSTGHDTVTDPFLHRLANQARRELKAIGDDSNNSLTSTDQNHTATSADGRLPHVDGYDIRRVLGRGGMGVVYEAWHVKLKRLVALKMVRAGDDARADELTRFRIEAEAAARLQHPNIVQVYEVGEQDGQPFLALEHVDGGSLAQHLRGDVRPAPEAAELVETLAQAMDYAHQRGVIHRDLKPANILLVAGSGRRDAGREQGTSLPPDILRPLPAVPKITDFGLAKFTAGGSDQTHSGAILGTPSYMAPEQAAGKTRDISTAVDVYALGAILYELLTGRPPHRGETAVDTVRQILTAPPAPPRRLRPDIPRDLETICLKCLEKEPCQRYAGAAVLAEDLRRFRAHEPIRARPTPVWRLAGKWARRNPTAAALVAVVVLAAAALAGVGLWYQGELARSLVDVRFERDQATIARGEAEAQRDEARHNLYLAQIPLAQRAWEAAHVGRVRELLEAARPQSAHEPDDRNFEWNYLRRLCETHQRTLRGHSGAVTAVAFRPDGKRFASAGMDGAILVWDADGDRPVGPPLKGHDRATAVAFSPDGTLLASAGADHRVLLWDLATGEVRHALTGHTGWVYQVAFSPDGRQLASASGDKSIKLWDVDAGREIQSLTGHADRVVGVAFSPVQRLLASASADRQVRLWDLGGDRPPRVLSGHRGWVYGVSFSPDGQSLASSSFDNTVRIWDVAADREPLKLTGHTDQVRGVAFGPDGRTIASASFDGTVRLWEAATGKQVLCLRGHIGNVNAVAFHPDGQRFVTAGDDRCVKVWDAGAEQEFAVAQRHAAGPVNVVCFHPNGRHLVSGGADQSVLAWDLTEHRPAAPFLGHVGSVHALAFSSSGKWLASGGVDRTVRLWGSVDRQLLHDFKGHSGRVSGITFRPGDGQLASASFDGRVRVWDLPEGRLVLSFPAHRGRVLGLTYSPSGRILATCGDDRLVQLWDAESGTHLRALEGHSGWAYCVAFSPNGKWLASGSADGTIRIWDPTTGAERFRLEGHAGRVNSLAFRHDSLRLASAGYFDQTVKIWELTRGQELLSLTQGNNAYAVAWSPDGFLLASCAADPSVRLWNATPVEAERR